MAVIPADEVRKDWLVNPGTPGLEWVVMESCRLGTLWEIRGPTDEHGYCPVMHVPPGQLVDAAPPPRMITVPAMDDEALAWARKIADPTNPGCREVWPFVMWLADAIAAHEREAT